jgi:hypothetical protein
MSTPPTYTLAIRSLPSEVPADVRLKRLLKMLRRGYQFACVRVEEVPVEPAAQEPAASERIAPP